MAGQPKRRAMLAAIEQLAGVQGHAAIDNWIVAEIEAGNTAFKIITATEKILAAGDSGYETVGVACLYRWLNRNGDIVGRIARARVISAHAWADKAGETAEHATEGNARASAVRLKGFQWQAERRNRAVYGESQPQAGINGALNVGNLYLQVLELVNTPARLSDRSTDVDHSDTVDATVEKDDGTGNPQI
jgi:hypothetical protein